QLDGYFPVKLRIMCGIDHPHSAPANLFAYHVTAKHPRRRYTWTALIHGLLAIAADQVSGNLRGSLGQKTLSAPIVGEKRFHLPAQSSSPAHALSRNAVRWLLFCSSARSTN